ncbi:MAG: elongation factor P maturation arginine rhamnosyltransferase EarP [Azonexus sp.]|jgi:uncharacterized repeat protein (TIGR03837 family)|nr:elongation factor P maturation arginine rhamnosyltransferase EarP [Azonexus sp.]
MAAMQLHWDIFCRVIDNYGDIGVCWRLARQLVAEHGRQVRLWVDDVASLSPLCPEVDPSVASQSVAGVEIRHWTANATVTPPAEVIIEAFACELPPAYVQAMAAAERKPCWINLEYLTAESWAEECHGMASPHPTLPLTKYFFFPGFSSATGGLLREKELLCERDEYLSILPYGNEIDISLFCYETAPLGPLLEALSASAGPVRCHVFPGKPQAAVAAYLGGSGPWHLGNASIKPVPFVPMDDYDPRLWACDVNFVRGEDSFVRAQWAAKPFIWQVYRQDDEAHLVKLEAFLERYCRGMSDVLEGVVRRMFLAWNTGVGVAPAWCDFLDRQEEIAAHNRRWADQLATAPDLATALVKFCAAKV